MAATSLTKSFDALVSSVLHNTNSTVKDAIFDGLPVLKALQAKGKVRTVSGGDRIQEPLMYAANPTAMAFSNYQIVDTTPSDGITSAFYQWREYNVALVISRYERNVNSGSKERIFSLLDAKKKQADMSLRDLLSQKVFTAQSGLHLDGLPTLVATAAGSAGGIDSSNEAWWDNQRTTSGVTAANLVDSMRSMFNTCSRNVTKPDLLVTTQTIHEAYESQLEPHARFTLSNSNSNLGFGVGTLVFRTVPLVWDGDCNSGVIYFLNTEFLGFVMHGDGDFKYGPAVTPSDQHATVSNLYFMGNLTCSNRRFQGIISSITV